MIAIAALVAALPVLLLSNNTAFGQSSALAQGTGAASAPEGLRATIGTSQMTFVDPKTGKLVWTADVVRFVAQTAADGEVTGLLDGVDGILYQTSKPADNMKAATVTVENDRKIVRASGGVKITSLTRKGTTLTCDTLTWYTAENKMVGAGHVVFRTGGFTQSGPSFLADTRMKNVVMPAPGATDSKAVHVTFQ